jgi:hypothetical protein
MKWKPGDKFVELNYPEWGIGTVIEIIPDSMEWFTCKWENITNQGSRFSSDVSIIPLEIYKSPLYKKMREE